MGLTASSTGSKLLQNHVHRGLNWLNDQTGNQDISLNAGTGQGYSTGWQRTNSQPEINGGIYTYPAGEGDSQNLQPYITCYMWKRVK